MNDNDARNKAHASATSVQDSFLRRIRAAAAGNWLAAVWHLFLAWSISHEQGPAANGYALILGIAVFQFFCGAVLCACPRAWMFRVVAGTFAFIGFLNVCIGHECSDWLAFVIGLV